MSLIKDINQNLGITVIIIYPPGMSVVEEVCNKVAILDHGNVVEEGLVSDVFTKPHQSDAAKRLRMVLLVLLRMESIRSVLCSMVRMLQAL